MASETPDAHRRRITMLSQTMLSRTMFLHTVSPRATFLRTMSPLALPLLATFLLSLTASELGAQDAVVEDFKQNCSSCHTIGGGRLTGPDLKDVEARKDRAWLVRFIQDPVGVLNSGDAYALKLKEESRGAIMPGLSTMTGERAEALLDLVAEESKLEKSQFAGVQISQRPLTEKDVQHGKDLFTGRAPLSAGGAACIACHSISGLEGLGGGRLGPDLTKVFERRLGRKGLTAWLSAPATPAMQAVFKDHPFEGEEILALVAFFEDRAPTAEETDSAGTLLFLVLGFGATVAVLYLMARIWSGRLRAVRKPLLNPVKMKVSA